MNFIITQNGVLNHLEKNILQDQSNNHTIYEVIRVMNGTSLFLEDHFDRLQTSVQIRGLQLKMELLEFRHNIAELTKLNGQQNGNVKFTLSKVGKENQWTFSFIPSSYPTASDYQLGVATGLLFAERENPNAKVIQHIVREGANQLMADKKLYEVLLVDHNGMITEGSRSNVFFVKKNLFFTAPASKVLVGVTRKKIMECLNELNFRVIEQAVATFETGAFDAVFLTGTSPKVLPVNCIDSILFSPNNSLVEQLMERYDSMIATYLKTSKA